MPKTTSKIYVKDASDVPLVEHWAIITGVSVHIEGDERSRTNPGHGYPATTEYYIQYEAFTDKAEFESELERRIASEQKSFVRTKSIRGIHVCGVYQAETKIALTEKRS